MIWICVCSYVYIYMRACAFRYYKHASRCRIKDLNDGDRDQCSSRYPDLTHRNSGKKPKEQ